MSARQTVVATGWPQDGDHSEQPMESRVASFTGEDPVRHGGGSSRLDGRNKKGASMTETHEEHDDNPFVAALPPGSWAFHYMLRTKPGKAAEFMQAFHEWDYSDQNIVHQAEGMVHEGILYQSEDDENRFYLIGIWNNRESHKEVVAKVREMHPAWLDLLETPLVPEYLQIIG